MIHAPPFLAAIALAFASFRVGVVSDRVAARRRAFGWVVGSLVALLALEVAVATSAIPEVVALPWAELHFECLGWRLTAPFVDLLVALVAIGLAPVASHAPATLRAILRVIALALCVRAFDSHAAIAVAWVLQIVVAFAEIRRLGAEAGDPSLARGFAVYHGVSIASLGIGTAAFASGDPALGVAAWLVAIAIREAALPFHSWLPALMAKAPLGLVVALVAPQTGVCAQLGVLSEHAGGELAHGFALVGVVTSVIGAAVGLVQVEARRAAAWLAISQTGLVAFGLENVSEVGRAGAVLSWQVMALSLSGFTMTIAALEARRGPLSLQEHGGSFARTPRMAVAFLFLGFASVALPLTLGFVAEDLLVQGSIDEFPQIGLAVICATALNGVNVMRCFFVLFSGTRRHIGEHDLTRREAVSLTVVMAILLLGGLAPRVFLGASVHESSPAHSTHAHPSNHSTNPPR